MSAQKTEAIRVNVDPDTKAELERRAQQEDVSVAHLVRKAIKALLAASLIALVIIPAASAASDYTGWIQTAAIRMEMPRKPIHITDAGCPSGLGTCYTPTTRTIYMARTQLARWGWTPEATRVIFLHELGHAVDYTNGYPAKRRAFRQALGLGCKWTDISARGCDPTPSEMYAEQWAACALGISRNDLWPRLYAYGVPPWINEATLCSIIR